MKILRIFSLLFIAMITLLCTTACNDGKTYAELLTDEDHYVNNFLADHRVVLSVPSDTVFDYGPDAPYYRLEEDGMLYMQVLEPGTPGNRVENDQQIYFRYTKYDLTLYSGGQLPQGTGNNYTLGPAWFRYGNYQMVSSQTWGAGIQMPLAYLPIDCKVNLVVKSTYGESDNQVNVIPYLYELTYHVRE